MIWTLKNEDTCIIHKYLVMVPNSALSGLENQNTLIIRTHLIGLKVSVKHRSRCSIFCNVQDSKDSKCICISILQELKKKNDAHRLLITDLTSSNGNILYMHTIVNKDQLIYTDNVHLNNNTTVTSKQKLIIARLQIYLLSYTWCMNFLIYFQGRAALINNFHLPSMIIQQHKTEE